MISWYPHNIAKRVGSNEASRMMIRIFHIIPNFFLAMSKETTHAKDPRSSAQILTLCVGCSANFFTAALLLLSFPINCRLITAAERLTFYCAVKRVDNKNAISSYSALFSLLIPSSLSWVTILTWFLCELSHFPWHSLLNPILEFTEAQCAFVSN